MEKYEIKINGKELKINYTRIDEDVTPDFMIDGVGCKPIANLYTKNSAVSLLIHAYEMSKSRKIHR